MSLGAQVRIDSKPLRVPSDLDSSICLYQQLSANNREKFDRAAYWMDMASRQWTDSISASFASLVSSVESLTERGVTHNIFCDTCKNSVPHDVPGATEKFRAYFEKYAPGASLAKHRSKMYQLRSKILHGSELIQLDRDRALGWDPPGFNQMELVRELSGLTQIAARNWLKSPS